MDMRVTYRAHYSILLTNVDLGIWVGVHEDSPRSVPKLLTGCSAFDHCLLEEVAWGGGMGGHLLDLLEEGASIVVERGRGRGRERRSDVVIELILEQLPIGEPDLGPTLAYMDCENLSFHLIVISHLSSSAKVRTGAPISNMLTLAGISIPVGSIASSIPLGVPDRVIID